MTEGRQGQVQVQAKTYNCSTPKLYKCNTIFNLFTNVLHQIYSTIEVHKNFAFPIHLLSPTIVEHQSFTIVITFLIYLQM